MLNVFVLATLGSGSGARRRLHRCASRWAAEACYDSLGAATRPARQWFFLPRNGAKRWSMGTLLPARFRQPVNDRSASQLCRAAPPSGNRRNGVLYGGWERAAAPSAVNEAEGDFAVLSRTVLAGHGFSERPCRLNRCA
jgi:hypothetical protein